MWFGGRTTGSGLSTDAFATASSLDDRPHGPTGTLPSMGTLSTTSLRTDATDRFDGWTGP
jgi:hypothetical protein